MKILVVAENGFTRSSINVNLRSAGYALTEADPSCLLDVLTVMRGLLPHLVVIDYEIPLCCCETVVRIMREDPILARTPVILVVDDDQSEASQRMSRWEQVRILKKPLQVETLLQAVRDQFPTFSIDSLDRDPAV